MRTQIRQHLSAVAAKTLLAVFLTSLTSCAMPTKPAPTTDEIATAYVKLVLALGQHDADYVDAYYGPADWRQQAESSDRDLGSIAAEADELSTAVDNSAINDLDEMELLRIVYLDKQIASLAARVAMLRGDRYSFDEESSALYDAISPRNNEAHFAELIEQLEALLPGDGSVAERYNAFRSDFVVPPEQLDAVFRAAVDEARTRTRAQLELPEDESFAIEYVTDKSWSGYNWYQGRYRSLIQVNTDLPIFIDRAVDLAAHEGYPGHHVYNVLLEQHLSNERGWVEFTVYPLFSPQSFIAEGSANYGIDMAFPGPERLEFERDVLFPLAGIDPQRAAEYSEVQALAGRLSYAGNEAAREYLNGNTDAAAAADWLQSYGLMTPASAEQRMRFIDQYRAYVINYNLGRDMVAGHVEFGGIDAAQRWERFKELLASPRLPSGLEEF